jgi:hypothetical protein
MFPQARRIERVVSIPRTLTGMSHSIGVGAPIMTSRHAVDTNSAFKPDAQARDDLVP